MAFVPRKRHLVLMGLLLCWPFALWVVKTSTPEQLQRLQSLFSKAALNPELVAAVFYLIYCNFYAKIFIFLFLFRYIRLIGNLIGQWTYKPSQNPYNPTLTTKDVTVIVPTVDPFNADFSECIRSIVANDPYAIVIVTAGGNPNLDEATRYRDLYPQSTIFVSGSLHANKRKQLVQGFRQVHTVVTVLCDDHVFLPPNFLNAVLAPFENDLVGAVGTSKRVRRETDPPGTLSWRSFWNLMGVLYLERANFTSRGTNAIDGGISVISGRTAAYRTSILRDQVFIKAFLKEYILFGLIGPLNTDDDNFLTRWVINMGWKIKFQAGEEATMVTTLGHYPKFLLQCIRWSRTTWRSDFVSLFRDRVIWRALPWSTYAVYVSSLFNFALIYDAALVYTFYYAEGAKEATPGSEAWSEEGGSWKWMWALVLWILGAKMVKVAPYFWAHPWDLLLLPGYIVFGYLHSFIKLYALLTFWNVCWAGRNGVQQ